MTARTLNRVAGGLVMAATLTLALTGPNRAWAQSADAPSGEPKLLDRIPEALQGVFAEDPACRDQGEIWILGPHADIFIPSPEINPPGTFFVQDFPQVAELANGWILLFYDDNYQEVLLPDENGFTSRSVYDVSPGELVSDFDGVTAGADSYTFTRCDTAPAPVQTTYGELIAYQDSPLPLQCQEVDGTCLTALFDFLDLSGDSELSAAEIARGIRVAMMFGIAASIEESDVKAATWSNRLNAMTKVPALAQGIITQADYDGSGGLSLGEVTSAEDALAMAVVVAALADDTIRRQVPDALIAKLPEVLR